MGFNMENTSLKNLVSKVADKIKESGYSTNLGGSLDGEMGIFYNMDEAIEAARRAFLQYQDVPVEIRKKIVDGIRRYGRANVETLAKMAVEETKMGRVEDKIKKNLLVIEKTPGPEMLEQRIAYTGDNGLTLLERAPYGVIGSITPTTNPTATIINNGISMISGGNSVVFNVHPTAKRVSNYLVSQLNKVILENGGPLNLLVSMAEPTIASAKTMMAHKHIALIVVTGGPQVVLEAMSHPKKAICAGPGNPPVVVDATADIPKAAIDIINGASFDNNLVCILEKEVIAVKEIFNDLRREMLATGLCYEVKGYYLNKLEQLICPEGRTNKDFVGKNANYILEKIGIPNIPDSMRLVIAEVGEGHPFVQEELLMPVLGMVKVDNVDDAIAMARRVEHNFRHTAVMHSKCIANLSKMARVMDCSIFVKNASSTAGLGFHGEGYSTMTIASPTGEGVTTALSFTRERRCTLKDYFRIV